MGRRLGALAAVTMTVVATGATAQGFSTQDLTGVGKGAAAVLGPGFVLRGEARRVTLICLDCAGVPTVDVVLGRQEDGTEDRVRSGATSMGDLQRLCRSRSLQCTVSKLDVAPAVGWVSGYPLGDHAGSTAVVIRDGDLLTVRSLAKDPASARQAIERLLPLIRSRIVGP